MTPSCHSSRKQVKRPSTGTESLKEAQRSAKVPWGPVVSQLPGLSKSRLSQTHQKDGSSAPPTTLQPCKSSVLSYGQSRQLCFLFRLARLRDVLSI